MLVALLGVFALSGVAAVAAQAEKEEAPFWSREGRRLGAGETHYITAKVAKGSSFRLEANGVKITCTALKLEEGVLLGSNEGNPGLNDEIIEFEGCTVTGNGEGCKVKGGTILTRNIKSELVRSVPAPHEKILVEFKPEHGVTFTTIEFEPASKCKVTATKVTGEIAAEIEEDPENTGDSYLLSFPDEASITEGVLLVLNGESTKKTLEKFEAFTETAILTGKALVLLANEKKETELVKWSPLI